MKQRGRKYMSKSQTKLRPEWSYHKPEVTGFSLLVLGERGGLKG